MTIRKLTTEGLFESGVRDLVEGKLFAFQAVPAATASDARYGAWALGVAVANEPGYFPVPSHWCHGDDAREMFAHARELNAALGLDQNNAILISASSIRAQRQRGHNRMKKDAWQPWLQDFGLLEKSSHALVREITA